jgi:hypothetical protein
VTREAFRNAEIYAKTYPSFWFESKKSFYLLKQGYATFAELRDSLESHLAPKSQTLGSRVDTLFLNTPYLTFRHRCA